MATPTLETDRLILRPTELSDADAIQVHFAHWNIIQHLSLEVPWPYPAGGAKTFLEEVHFPAEAAGSVLAWAITIRSEGDDLIGWINFRFDANELGNRGFWLAEPYWGRGYMTEAVTAMQDYLFFELGIDRIMVTNSAANPASSRIKEKTAGTLLRVVDAEDHTGKIRQEVWEITKEAWTEHHKSNRRQ